MGCGTPGLDTHGLFYTPFIDLVFCILAKCAASQDITAAVAFLPKNTDSFY